MAVAVGDTSPAPNAPTAPAAIARALAPPLAATARATARATQASAPGTAPRRAASGHVAKRTAEAARIGNVVRTMGRPSVRDAPEVRRLLGGGLLGRALP